MANGAICWGDHRVYVSTALARERVGLEPIDDGVWRVHYASLALGILDERVVPRKVLGHQPNAVLQLKRMEAAA